MTRWRGRWLVAVLIAVLAVIGCGVGLANETEDAKELILFSSSDSITLYIDEGNEAISDSASIAIYARFNDYKTPIDNVKFSYTPKDSDKDILDGVSFDDAHSSTNNVDWYSYLNYSPVMTGTCIYTVTASASVDGKNYEASKDITFTVTDDTSDLPTSIELNSEYFDENGVYHGKELVIDEESGTAVIYKDDICPTYTIDNETATCYISCNINHALDYDGTKLIFKTAGEHTIAFIANKYGSNWQLKKDVTFTVNPAAATINPIILTGVPKNDTLIYSHITQFTIKAENPELPVNWDVSVSDDDIDIMKYVSDDTNTLNLIVSSKIIGIKGTITVNAYYDGHKDKATVVAFDVYTEAPTLLVDDLPSEIYLYMGDNPLKNLEVSANATLNPDIYMSDYSNFDNVDVSFVCSDKDNDVLSDIKVGFTFESSNHAYADISYVPARKGSCTYTFVAAISGTNYSVEKEVNVTVTDDISVFPNAVDINRDYFDKNNIYIKSDLVMPTDGTPLIIPFPDEIRATYNVSNSVYPCYMYSYWGGFHKDGLKFSKAGKYALNFIAKQNGANWQLEDSVYFIVKSAVQPENPTPTLSGAPEDDLLIDDVTSLTFTVENCEQSIEWEFECDNKQFTIAESYRSLDDDTATLKLDIYSNIEGITGNVTVKAYYYGYEDDAAIATFKVHTQPVEKPTLVIDLSYDGVFTLYSGESDEAINIETSGTFYLGNIAFSDKSPIHEFEPIITLTPNDEGGAFDCSMYSYEGNGFNGSLENSYEIRIAKLKYESLPAVGTHEYTLHVEVPDTDYIAEAPVTINVIDGTTVLPREIVLEPETEALFTNNVYNQNLYLNSSGKAAVVLDLVRDTSHESPELRTVCDKFIYCHDECTKGVTEDRKYMFTFDGAGQHYVVLHLASDYSNWYVERPLTFNVLDPEPVITSEPYYPPFNPTEEPTLEPTFEPTAEPTLAPTPTAAPTPTPAPIKEVTAGGKNLNVRLSPVSGAVIAKLPDGTRLEVLGTENGWSRIRATMPDGSVVEGFVMDDYLSDVEPTAAPATPTPATTATAQPGATTTPTPAPIKEVTTGGKNLKVRLNPGTGAVIAKLPDGTRLEVLGTENGWSRIRATMPDGSVVEGFVMDDYLSDVEPTAAPATPTPAATATAQPGAATTPAPLPSGEPTPAPAESAAKVNTSGSALRLRSDPSTSSDVLVRMPNGADVTILETVDGWTRIRFVAQNGKEYEGWASSDFIKADERPAPTATPAPTAVPAPTATPAPNSGARVDAGGKKLKLRRQPGSSGSGVTTKIPDGAELIVLEYGEEWSLCSYNGVTGYCATAYLKFN